MSERHSVLLLNIGTFAEEDEAYELLNSLRMSLPFVVMITSLFDALLAAAYLKWFHPWKILLQEVNSCWFYFFSFTITVFQEPDLWEIKTEDDVTKQESKVELF